MCGLRGGPPPVTHDILCLCRECACRTAAQLSADTELLEAQERVSQLQQELGLARSHINRLVVERDALLAERSASILAGAAHDLEDTPTKEHVSRASQTVGADEHSTTQPPPPAPVSTASVECQTEAGCAGESSDTGSQSDTVARLQVQVAELLKSLTRVANERDEALRVTSSPPRLCSCQGLGQAAPPSEGEPPQPRPPNGTDVPIRARASGDGACADPIAGEPSDAPVTPVLPRAKRTHHRTSASHDAHSGAASDADAVADADVDAADAPGVDEGGDTTTVDDLRLQLVKAEADADDAQADMEDLEAALGEATVC